jgi:hypothetical protein
VINKVKVAFVLGFLFVGACLAVVALVFGRQINLGFFVGIEMMVVLVTMRVVGDLNLGFKFIYSAKFD